MTRDLAAAERFYGRVLGWDFRHTRLGEGFRMAFHEGTPVAGIGDLADRLSVPVAWTPYFAVEDADATGARVTERSGTVAVGPVSFGTGRAALAADRDGAVFGIWQGAVIPDWHVGREEAPAWLELRTRHAFDAAVFYGEVLEWACGRDDCCDPQFDAGHVVLRRNGRPVARLRGGDHEEAPDPSIRPRWHVYFRVPDLDAAVAAAEELGARPTAEHGRDDRNRWTTLRDPQGALFGISAPLGEDADRPEPAGSGS
ncbi:VOC family protein [Streptomyces sp. NPDC097619]|uniref:VOC family protein n=1 Tax=Streptomyces sp. NPDC097619 TaxID=3157228 RepID=UPI00332CFD7E